MKYFQTRPVLHRSGCCDSITISHTGRPKQGSALWRICKLKGLYFVPLEQRSHRKSSCMHSNPENYDLRKLQMTD